MATIAFLGLGAMGSRMAANLLKAGHSLQVWNRNPARTDGLQSLGAVVAGSPREAATGAELVLAMLRDDPASEQVWLDPDTGAALGMTETAVAVDCSTLSPAWVRRLASTLADRGIPLLDAPVAGSLPQAEAAQLIFLAGGDSAALERIRPLLLTMGATVHHTGDNGSGATIKLAVNGMLGIQIAAFAEIIGMLKAANIDPARALDIMSSTPVISPAAKGYATMMVAGNAPLLFSVALAEKDLGYVTDTAGSVGQTVPDSAAVREVMQAAIAQGLGDNNVSELWRLYAS